MLRFLYRAETRHDELHFAETNDGVRLALHRYLPSGESPRPTPVIRERAGRKSIPMVRRRLMDRARKRSVRRQAS